VYVAFVEIRDVMTEGVVSVMPTATVRQVAELMRERNVGSVVLVHGDGAIAGFVTDRDLALGALTDGRDSSDPAEAHASSPVVTAEPGMGVEEAAELMVRHGIRRLPVVSDGRLTGIVTLDDLAVRTGDLELAQHMTVQITRAALPGFYFHDRGG
jgi:CBS domain-containing protein